MKLNLPILMLSIVACAVPCMLCGCGMLGGSEVKGTPPPTAGLAMQVGQNALMVAQGQPPLKYRAPKTGTVAVVDMSFPTPGMVAFGIIDAAGSIVDVNPAAKAIMVRDPKQKNRSTVIGQGVDVTHTYAIYFTPGSGMGNLGNEP